MLYLPNLQLIPEEDGEFSLLAVTPVQSFAFSASSPIEGSPKGSKLPKRTRTYLLPLKFDPASDTAARMDAVVKHRVRDLKLKSGDVVKVFVALGDVILGEASIALKEAHANRAIHTTIFAAKPAAFGITRATVQLSEDDCAQIAVIATPAKTAHDVFQKLRELGVIDPIETRKHRIEVGNEMVRRGTSIDTRLVDSGPNVTVDACGASIFRNQGS